MGFLIKKLEYHDFDTSLYLEAFVVFFYNFCFEKIVLLLLHLYKCIIYIILLYIICRCNIEIKS